MYQAQHIELRHCATAWFVIRKNAPGVLLGEPDHGALTDAWTPGFIMAEQVGGELLLLPAGV